jgi:hypothetical protein
MELVESLPTTFNAWPLAGAVLVSRPLQFSTWSSTNRRVPAPGVARPLGQAHLYPASEIDNH